MCGAAWIRAGCAAPHAARPRFQTRALAAGRTAPSSGEHRPVREAGPADRRGPARRSERRVVRGGIGLQTVRASASSLGRSPALCRRDSTGLLPARRRGGFRTGPERAHSETQGRAMARFHPVATAPPAAPGANPRSEAGLPLRRPATAARDGDLGLREGDYHPRSTPSSRSMSRRCITGVDGKRNSQGIARFDASAAYGTLTSPVALCLAASGLRSYPPTPLKETAGRTGPPGGVGYRTGLPSWAYGPNVRGGTVIQDPSCRGMRGSTYLAVPWSQ